MQMDKITTIQLVQVFCVEETKMNEFEVLGDIGYILLETADEY